MISYYMAKAVSQFVCCLPQGVRNFIGVALGHLGWFLVPRWRKKMAIDNISHCLQVDKIQAQQIAKQSVYRFGSMLLEVLYFPKIKQENLSEFVTFKNKDILDQALAEGKGVILATAHYGNWELMAHALALNGYPLLSVARKQNNVAMDRFINEYRSLAGGLVTYKSGVLEMVRYLSEGFCIGLLMDQDAGPDGIMVDFLRKNSSTPKGPAALARLKGAPIVPILIYQERPGKHEIYCYPSMHVTKTSDREADIRKMTEELVEVLQGAVQARPAEWFWLHNRWKTKK